MKLKYALIPLCFQFVAFAVDAAPVSKHSQLANDNCHLNKTQSSTNPNILCGGGSGGGSGGSGGATTPATYYANNIRVRCESIHGADERCQLPRVASHYVFGTINIHSQDSCFSNAGADYGIVSGQHINVGKYCRATFPIVLHNTAKLADLSCSSEHYNYKTCTFNVKPFNNGNSNVPVWIRYRHSDSWCKKGTDWGVLSGTSSNQVKLWVDNGCRATFTVHAN
ncbi:DUF3011 domain-containing protein [Pleionea sp. CnH1-48]|uniref:DUF3011 domain-containing protein n=1 Tax=Pleionea sp. CnH1-48 TaxID=2954494 RepID=UPI0020985E57|nr:DUF3011 domain-containing protein [Pleionea sp. CnH1-48]MCO7226397.1 DUF3011 domain-containing protein [Pleionea sp. CnH1-48]